MLTGTNQLWNGSGWDSQSSYGTTHSYTYDANNNMLSNLLQYWDHGVMWFQQKELSTYDANNNLVMNLDQSWDGNAWKDSGKYQYTYDANNNLVGEVHLNWSGSNWNNAYQYFYTYDANNNQTSHSGQMWDGSKWLNYSQYNSSFDANGMQMNDVHREWDEAGAVLVSGDSTYYYYHSIVTGIPGLSAPDATVYPNPTKGKITISSNSPISTIEIFNLSGKRIYSDTNVKQQTSKELNLSGYSKGIYFIKIYNGTKFYSRKIIVQ
jgi:hypothetical protein